MTNTLVPSPASWGAPLIRALGGSPGAARPLANLLAGAALIGLSAWGIGWQRDLVPDYIRLLTPADMRAAEWVRASTPPEARFLVNSFPIYDGAMVVGTDGGWWLPLLSGRQTNVPPMTYGSERPETPGFPEQANALVSQLRGHALGDSHPYHIDLTRPAALKALRDAGITYVYSGARPLQGPGTYPQVDRIDTAKLRRSPDFRLVYDRGGVEIFALVGAGQ